MGLAGFVNLIGLPSSKGNLTWLLMLMFAQGFLRYTGPSILLLGRSPDLLALRGLEPCWVMNTLLMGFAGKPGNHLLDYLVDVGGSRILFLWATAVIVFLSLQYIVVCWR